MSLSVYSAKAKFLETSGLPIPHSETELYPSGVIGEFDLGVMVGWYLSPTLYHLMEESVGSAETITQEESKVISDEVRLHDWIDAILTSEPWTEQAGTSTDWTES